MGETVGKVETKSEEDKLADMASQALRGPRYGIYEQLLCQHLVQATVTGSSLRKIQLVCEGAYMVDEEKRKGLQIDMERLEVVKTICDAFQNRTETLIGKEWLVELSFGFKETEENYNKYIAPWRHTAAVSYYPYQLIKHHKLLGVTFRTFHCRGCGNFLADDYNEGTPGIKDNKCIFCGNDVEPSYRNPFPYDTRISFQPFKTAKLWELFFAFCHNAAREGYSNLKTNFLNWAMPFVMELMAKLTKVVRPEIYNEIARMFVKARRETETGR